MRMNNSVRNSSSLSVHVVECYYIHYEYPLYGAHYIIQFIVMVTASCLILPTVLLNGIAVFVFSAKDQLKMSRNILLLSTSICDLFIGMIGLPTAVYTLVLLLFLNRHECIVYFVHYYGVYLFAWVSFLTTILMAFGRHVAIFKPHFYAAKVKGKHVPYVASLASIWLFLIFVIILSIVLRSQLPLACVSVIIPPMIIYTMYVYIRAHSYLKKIHTNTQDFCVRGKQSEYKRQVSALKESKVVRLTLFMLLSLCICYLPSCIMYIILMVVGNRTTHFVDTFGKVTQLIAVTKCLVNPVIYYNSNHVFRVHVQKFSHFNAAASDNGNGRVDSPPNG